MKKPKVLFPVLLFALFLMIQGCAGTPEPEPQVITEPAPEPEPAEPAPEAPAPEAERAEAAALREAVLEAGTELTGSEGYTRAEESFSAAEQAYGTDNAEAKLLYIEAAGGYRELLDSAYGEELRTSRGESVAEKEAADALFAARAAPEPYARGTASLEEAESLSSAYRYQAAIGAYTEARAAFREAAEIAARKKEAALQALEKARSAYSATEEELKMEQEQLNEERQSAEEETRLEYESADLELEEAAE